MGMEIKHDSNSHDLIKILNEILKKKTYLEIAKNFNVAVGTVKRWNELKKVPKQYTFELLKFAGINIDYSKFNYKEKDQFFTPSVTSEYCYSKFKEILTKYGDSESAYNFIEPSAGNGVFLKILPEGRRIGLDIEPKFS